MYKNIVSFVARGTNSGKTYLVQRLIAEFKSRGLKVAAVKHTNHFKDPDSQGKDTNTFAQKGADRVALFSDHAFMLYELKCPEPDHLVTLVGKDMDLILVEGYKHGPFPKIEIFNPSLYDAPLCTEDPDDGFIALVSRERVDVGLPWFPFEDLAGICDFIEEHVRR